MGIRSPLYEPASLDVEDGLNHLIGEEFPPVMQESIYQTLIRQGFTAEQIPREARKQAFCEAENGQTILTATYIVLAGSELPPATRAAFIHYAYLKLIRSEEDLLEQPESKLATLKAKVDRFGEEPTWDPTEVEFVDPHHKRQDIINRESGLKASQQRIASFRARANAYATIYTALKLSS